MSISNPWTVYTVALAAIILIYYTFVGWKYYRRELRSLFKGKTKNRIESSSVGDRVKPSESAEPDPVPSDGTGQAATHDEALFSQVQALNEYLVTEIEEAHQKDYNKQDLIQMLQMILKEYGVLKGTPFQHKVNRRIDAECAKYGQMHLAEDDKDQLWSIA